MASLEIVARLSEPSIQGAQRARELVKKANESLEQSRRDHEKICEMHPKLAFLISENQAQSEVCRRLEDGLKRHQKDVDMVVDTKGRQAEELQREMAMVIELLKSREVVEREFRSPHVADDNGVVPKHTLYDHIDQDAVDVLERSVVECLGELRSIGETDGKLCRETLGKIANVELPMAEDISVTWDGVHGIGALVAESQSVVDEIMQDSQSMDHHCDQLRGTIRELEAEGGVLSTDDYNVLLRDTSEIPAIVDDMQEALESIQRRTEETHVRYLQYSAFYSDNRRQFEAITQISQAIDSYVSLAASPQTQFGLLSVQLERSLEDTWGLVSWYRNFHSSYDGLIAEVHRRRQMQGRLYAVVEDMRSQLDNMYMEEVRERAGFVDRFGMFLPSDLCPFIQDPPMQFTVEEVGDGERLASVMSHETTRHSKKSADDNDEQQEDKSFA
ncbi:hypothetical protein FB645_000401 [Coemansia sp. IMI 203386]|nr:hypothetical protein FB645_000401 [Coemansia sp. IMI 203386]